MVRREWSGESDRCGGHGGDYHETLGDDCEAAIEPAGVECSGDPSASAAIRSRTSQGNRRGSGESYDRGIGKYTVRNGRSDCDGYGSRSVDTKGTKGLKPWPEVSKLLKATESALSSKKESILAGKWRCLRYSC